MRRLRNFSEFQKCLLLHRFSLYFHDGITKSSVPIRFICQNATQLPHTDGSQTKVSNLLDLFTDKWGSPRTDGNQTKVSNLSDLFTDKCGCDSEFRENISKLKDKLLRQYEDVDKINKVLEENGAALFRRYSGGFVMVGLLTELNSSPSLAMEVFEWRRKQLDYAPPMTVKEYSKGINIASRLNRVDLAVELFKEACNKQLKGTSLFNALMIAYLYNGLAMKCRSLFRDLKMDPTCSPTIVTYNILISAFGRLMLVDNMEATLREVKDLNLTPNISTYKGLISGYITAWMWEEMENTYSVMKAGPVKPNLDIHLLMLRGYALAGKLDRMEEIYEMVRDHVDCKEIPLIRVMIRAYYKSSDAARVQKVEQLLSKIPENDYRPWLNIIIICLYAKEDLLQKMENSINVAFEHKIYVAAAGVMNLIISSYFRQNAVDKLAEFVQHAQTAGWKICRSLYHCKMVMYGSQMRLSEMERVLDEMYMLNMHKSKKTYWILFKSYKRWGERSKLEQVAGMMWKYGYKVQVDTCISS